MCLDGLLATVEGGIEIVIRSKRKATEFTQSLYK